MLGSHAASHERPKAFICSLACMSASAFLDVRDVRKLCAVSLHGPISWPNEDTASIARMTLSRTARLQEAERGCMAFGKHPTQKEGPRRPWLGHRIRFCMLTAQCPPTWPPPMILPQISHKSPALHEETIPNLSIEVYWLSERPVLDLRGKEGRYSPSH